MSEAARTRVLIESVLGKAQIVLKELLMNSSPNNSSDIKDAEEKIDRTLKNEQVLAEAAQQIRYHTLVQNLRAKGMPITPEELDEMDDF